MRFFTQFYIIMLLLTLFPTLAIDNPHFYRATHFWGEPRFEKSWLTTIDTSFGIGSTASGRNSKGHKTALLNILGPHNMQQLGSNVPGLSPANPLDQILINLEALPMRDGFGQLVFNGKFRILEGIINIYQNLINGFFLQAYLPIRKLKMMRIDFTDLSPNDSITPNINTPSWQAFLQNFNAILSQFSLNLDGVDRTGFGDLTLLGGWAINYENTEILDYIDIDSKIGVLFPTGVKKSENRPFDLPTGYNGFFGIPLKFNASIGAFEWLTIGCHLGALFFFKQNKKLRLKTDLAQNGFIKLAQESVDFEPGTIWDVDVYTKADHIAYGLSFLFGYAFNTQDAAELQTKDSAFSNEILNSDSQYKSWQMHTLHFLIEYDFAKKVSDIGPRIGLFYDLIVGGNRIFNTYMANSYVGVDIAWCF
ncbi:MAG: hypothetical protein WDZ41_04460 [Candidatus Babeliales bacterium]